MVRRLLSLLSSDITGVHMAAYLLAGSAFGSQILALIRDRLLAHEFGAGTRLDIYYAAFRVQDFIFFSVASLVSLAVLIPILIGKIEEGNSETKKFLNSLFTAFFLAVALFGGITALLAPKIVPILFPGLLGKGYDADLIFLTRLLLLSPLILGTSNLIASITQAYRRFYLYALSPILYNLGIVLGILFFYPVFGLRGLGYGVIIGALFHLSIQVPFIISQGLVPRFTLKWEMKELKRLVSLSLPRTFTLSLNHIAMLVLAGLASLMPAGSISVFNLSLNLSSVPVSIIGASYSVAAFPILARHFLKKETKEFSDHFTTALRHIMFWSFPALTIFVVMRAQIVRVILGSGNFSWDDTRLTAACLALLALSIVFQNISLLFVRAFYAAGDTRRPLAITVFSSLTIIILAFWFRFLFATHEVFRNFLESLFRVNDISGTEVLVLPLAFSIGSLVGVVLFWIVFRRFLAPFTIKLGNSAFHSFAASVFMGLVIYEALDYFGTIFDLDTFFGIFFQGGLSALLGISLGIFVLYILKNDEFLEIVRSLKRRSAKTEVVQTESPVEL